MDKEALFSDEFLKNFKSGEEFQSFMKNFTAEGWKSF